MAFRKPLTKSFFRTDLRSSRPEVFCKKDVFRNFTKFKGKHLCWSLFFNKVTALRRATLLKKRLWHRCLTVNFVKFLRTSFFIEHLWWLLLLLKDDCEKILFTQQTITCSMSIIETLEKRVVKHVRRH